MSTLRSRIQTVQRLESALHLVWQTAPRWTLVSVALVLAQGALPFVSLYLLNSSLDPASSLDLLALAGGAYLMDSHIYEHCSFSWRPCEIFFYRMQTM